MPLLVIVHPHGAPDVHPLRHLRLTIGRSARNDICVPDPFASRIHAEVRFENDQYILRDLGSANGTFYNDERIAAPVTLALGSQMRIGETQIEFRDENRTQHLSVAALNSAALDATPSVNLNSVSDTILDSANGRTTSGLLDSIEAARTKGTGETAETSSGAEAHNDLLALIGKVGVTLLASATLDETLAQVASLVFDAVPAERCLIMLRRRTEELPFAVGDALAGIPPDELLASLEVHTAVERAGGAVEIKVGSSIIEEVILRGRSVLTSDAQRDPLFRGHTSIIRGVRSVLAVPLGVGKEIFGLIYADSQTSTGSRARFTENHLKVLTTLASVAAIRVQHARLLEEHLARERFERELYLAREIQQRFQPLASPVVEGYDLLGISFSCYEIGGDYYDFIQCPDGRLVVALGDVSGKGTSAALLMSSLHAAVHAQVSSQCAPVDTIRAVNRYLAANIPTNRFITLFYAELNPATGRLTFANAGHNPPLIVRPTGATERLDASGVPLGILPEAEYQEGCAQLEPGDALVIYSDGVTETQNPQGEEFGIKRLERTVARYLERSAAGIRDRIEAALTEFADGTAAADDITLVIVKRDAVKG